MQHNKDEIIRAWAWVRANNQSIPNDTLDLMKNAALCHYELIEALQQIAKEIDFFRKVGNGSAVTLCAKAKAAIDKATKN
jgi:hypothetical protein